MYSDEDIASAVQAGIMSKQTATAFRDHIAQQTATVGADEEQFRLVTGFNDVFVTIACLLLLGSINWIVQSWQVGTILQAAAAWGLAEYFTRQRRMALPSIVLLLAFVGSVLATSFIFLDGLPSSEDLAAKLTWSIPSVAAIAAWLHWLRFKVPIAVAATTGAIMAGAILLLLELAPEAKLWMSLITLLTGLAVFAIAMRWDASDTLRQTGRSDVAFWLHLTAAPLIAHPLFSKLDIFNGDVGIWQAIAVIILYFVIAIVSISIDRRALMVSALIYVLYAFDLLWEQYGIISTGFAITSFIIAAGLLLLSAFWRRCRQYVLQLYPDFVLNRLPGLR